MCVRWLGSLCIASLGGVWRQRVLPQGRGVEPGCVRCVGWEHMPRQQQEQQLAARAVACAGLSGHRHGVRAPLPHAARVRAPAAPRGPVQQLASHMSVSFLVGCSMLRARRRLASMCPLRLLLLRKGMKVKACPVCAGAVCMSRYLVSD